MSSCESSKTETNKKGEKCYEQVKKCKCIVKERLLGSSNKPKPIQQPVNPDPCAGLDFNDPIFCNGSRQPQMQMQLPMPGPGPSPGPGPGNYGMFPTPGPTPPGVYVGQRMNQPGNYYSEIQPRVTPTPPYGNYSQTPSNVYYDSTYYGSAGGYQR